MNKNYIFGIAMLASIFSSNLYGQAGKLSGSVFDANGIPAPYAIVSLLKDGEVVNGANADALGRYDIQPIDSGVYDVKADVLDAGITITGVVIKQNQTQFLDITLNKAIIMDGDTNVIIHLNIPRMNTNPIQFRTISGNQFRQSALGRE